jgi:hypothetical protein
VCVCVRARARARSYILTLVHISCMMLDRLILGQRNFLRFRSFLYFCFQEFRKRNYFLMELLMNCVTCLCYHRAIGAPSCPLSLNVLTSSVLNQRDFRLKVEAEVFNIQYTSLKLQIIIICWKYIFMWLFVYHLHFIYSSMPRFLANFLLVAFSDG